MKSLFKAVSEKVLGLFLSEMRAGACFPSYCCKPGWKTNCAQACVVRTTQC